ncbi:MAG: DUF4190 domain-containing protein [Persicimonas sp.]
MFQSIRSFFVLAALRMITGHVNQNQNYGPPSQPPTGGQGQQSPSGMAIGALICGIGAWTFLPGIGGILGAILGWIEMKKIERGESPQKGETYAKVGFWLSVASLVTAVLGTCASIALIVFIYGGFAAFIAAMGIAGA